jgi:hypothetical protein
VEEYVLDELAASADAALPGLGPLAVGLARLAVEAGRAVTLDAMEVLVTGQGRELLRGLVQLSLDVQAAGEVRLARVAGADGVMRTRAEPGHTRPVVTRLGEVTVRRIAYRAGVKGVPSLFPRDGVLNLPPGKYSWQLQQLAVMFTRSGAYALAGEFVHAVTVVRIGKRQLEQITARAAADAAGFYPALAQDQPGPGGQPEEGRPGPGRPQDGRQEEEPEQVLAISADGKGVAMRPDSRRRRTVAPDQRVKNFRKRRGSGENCGKRMAETGCVFDVSPVPRTPEQVMAPSPPGGKDAPRSLNRWYTTDITADRAQTISDVFDQAERRDPGHARTWIALADGDNYQIGLFQAQAADRGIDMTILVDFIHVLEYLWKAAWCFFPARDPAMEDWVTTQALDILHGRTPQVITRIRQLAGDHPPQGSEHAKIIRKTLHYLDAKQPYLDYPKALAAGWPIATGVIEGACRHLVQDRMGITGARWSTSGAQAILWLRAIRANGDTGAYWTWHIQQEHQRNHLSRYHATFELAA